MNANINAAPVAVATTDPVATFNVSDCRTLGLSVKNTGAAALDAFEVWARFAFGGPQVQLSGVATDFTTPAYPVVKASGSPVTLAAGAVAWMFLDVTGIYEVQLKASSAVSATTLQINASLKFSN